MNLEIPNNEFENLRQEILLAVHEYNDDIHTEEITSQGENKDSEGLTEDIKLVMEKAEEKRNTLSRKIEESNLTPEQKQELDKLLF